MLLSPGARLGPYEVVSAIGAGGMGEVYRARDARLNRDVALKILPAEFAADPERAARFEQEARATAALNHPNVLTVFDIGVHGGVTYLASELLEGTTLRTALERPISVSKCCDWAAEVALGLAAAHARHIVHRDIKPENLFVTRDGRIKILDFGLARVRPPIPDHEQTTQHGPGPKTQEGFVLGTVAYMAPEQARGLAADERSDIFSLGVVLYEMLAGRRPFNGASAVESMRATLADEPADFERAVPQTLDRIVRRCLEKRPEDRFHSAHDLALALDAANASRSQPVAAATGSRRAWALPAALLLAAASGVVGALWISGAGAPELQTFQRLTFRRGTVQTARFEPGSRNVVYSARWQGGAPATFSVHPSSPESQPVGPPDSILMSISPAQEAAVILASRLNSGQPSGTLAVMPLGGGGARELATGIVAADFCPDGQLAVAEHTGDTNRIHLPLGRVIREEADGVVSTLRCSPAGGLIAMSMVNGGLQSGLKIIDASGNLKADVAAAVTGLAWRPDGRELWYTRDDKAGQSTLLALIPGGGERVVWRGRSFDLQDIAADGAVLAVAPERHGGVFVQQAGSASAIDTGWLGGSEAVAISPAGDALLFNERGDAGGAFYLSRFDGSPPVRLGQGFATAWSPDGKRVLSVKDTFTWEEVPVGAGAARALRHPDVESIFGWYSSNGGDILINGRRPGQPWRFWLMNASGATRPVGPDGLDHWYRQQPLSNDGRLVAAYKSGEAMAGTLAIYPLEGGAPLPVAGMNADDVVIQFSPDDRHLLVYDRDRLPARIFELDYRTGRRTLWREFAPADSAGIPGFSSVLMNPSGSVVAYNYLRTLGAAYLVAGLK